MNWTAISAVADVFGAVAVVLSLIYVAAEVRHNTTALTRAASADAIAGIRHWNETIIGDPVMAQIFSRGVEDINALDEDGRTRFVVLMLNFLKTFEDMHYQFTKGAMEPEVWSGWEQLARIYLTRPGIRQYWAERQQVFSPVFRAWMERLEPPNVRPVGRIASEGIGAPVISS